MRLVADVDGTIRYMDFKPQPHAKDPTQASQNETPKTQVCRSCCADLPMSYFSTARFMKSGYRDVCKECRSQGHRLYRKHKYQSVSKVDDSLVRSVYHHNMELLNLGLHNKLEMVAFSYRDAVEYKIFFGPNGMNGMQSLTIFSMDGSMYREFIYSGKDSGLTETLIGALKHLNLRLELSQAHLLLSKRIIYLGLS